MWSRAGAYGGLFPTLHAESYLRPNSGSMDGGEEMMGQKEREREREKIETETIWLIM